MVIVNFIFSQLYLFPSVIDVVNVNGQAGKAGLGSVPLSRWPSDHQKKKTQPHHSGPHSAPGVHAPPIMFILFIQGPAGIHAPPS